MSKPSRYSLLVATHSLTSQSPLCCTAMGTVYEYNLSYTDVSEMAWYYAPVTALSNAGVFVGYDGKFSPDDSFIWAQLLSIFSRFIELSKGAALSNINTAVG